MNLKQWKTLENLRTIVKVFELKNNDMSRCVNPDYLKTMMDAAKAFNWLVHITGWKTLHMGVLLPKAGLFKATL